MNNVKLKPCPFCGSTDLETESLSVSGARKLWRAGCVDCGVWYMFLFDTEEEAVEVWNTRYVEGDD